METLVGKVGSMALIRKEDNDIDYNTIARLASELKPGMIWVSSGATEIGRVDYIRRHGKPLAIEDADAKADYAAQGQAILMQNYRGFIAPDYSVRQLLVEHTHFNEPEKRAHIKRFIERQAAQNAIPIINYNDPVSDEENRKMELAHLRDCETCGDIVECVDNDETAAVIAGLIGAKTLLLLTSADGIYKDPADKSTLVRSIRETSAESMRVALAGLQSSCQGASRKGANGMAAKIKYIIEPATKGTTVIIGSPKYRISEHLAGVCPQTRIMLA